MDDIPTHIHPDPAVVTIGDLDPVHGKHVEMDYTGQLVAGRYRIEERIGSGGMADVYRARDERLRCAVAVKFLKPRLASEEWCARMFQEARASAAIDHPHLLRVTDVGRIGPTIYLAMDLLNGASFAAVLRAQPGQRLPWWRVFELLLPVAGAFQAAHDRGFIHRDIKPDNLYVHRSGDEERVIVLDLGIVKRVAAAESLGVGLRPTATGYLLGTPAFMSPEQAAGDPVDVRTDMYSFGVTLYRAITGSLPFPPSGDAFVVLTKHLYEAPPGFAAQGLAAGDCPPEVEALVMRTLAKRPDDRHGSMRELAAAMRDALAAASLRPPALVPTDHADTDTGADPYTPLRSVRLRGFGRLSVVASVVGGLMTWPAIPGEVGGAMIEVGEEPIGVELSVRHIPEGLPPAIVALVAPPPAAPEVGMAPRVVPRKIGRELRRYTAALRKCHREHGDPDGRSLVVEIDVSQTGKILAARPVGSDASPLGHCVDDALRSKRVDSVFSGKHVHKVDLTVEEPR